jgi:glycosyltransferase involved in cell wall biosynthesis
MHILILNSEYSPIGSGAGNASANLARLLSDIGHEVTVVTSRFGNLPHREQNGNLTVIRIPALRRKQDRSGAPEQIAFIISASLWSLSLTRQPKPNVTLAFSGVPSGVVAYFIKLVFKIPYVVSLRGGDVPGFRTYDFNHFTALGYRRLFRAFEEVESRFASGPGSTLARSYEYFLMSFAQSSFMRKVMRFSPVSPRSGWHGSITCL